jgi:hypothetical protein
MLDPDGCLARSVMRTQPSTEETGAVRTRQLKTTNEKNWQPVLPKKCSAPLTSGRLMGVTVIRQSRLAAFHVCVMDDIDASTLDGQAPKPIRSAAIGL